MRVRSLDVLGRYGAESPGTRAFLAARWLWTPYVEVASKMPRYGRILDAGCGHGLLALAMALQEPERRILAVDHDRKRIRAAERAGKGLSQLRIQRGDYTDLPGGKYQGIVFMDVLHYLTYRAQEGLLKRAARRVGRGGRILFREVAGTGGLFSGWNKVHENIMTRLGWTQAEGLHFRDTVGWRGIAQRAGLKVRVQPLSRPPFADILFECVKP